jgi:hypothetical protein
VRAVECIAELARCFLRLSSKAICAHASTNIRYHLGGLSSLSAVASLCENVGSWDHVSGGPLIGGRHDRFIQGEDRAQASLLPASVEDDVDGDNLLRVIEAFVDGLDLDALGFAVIPAATGRPGYH